MVRQWAKLLRPSTSVPAGVGMKGGRSLGGRGAEVGEVGEEEEEERGGAFAALSAQFREE